MAKSDSEKYINGAILQGGGIPNVPNNKPMQYADRERQYMAGRTRLFPAARAKFSADYVQARVQGISKTDFFKWYRTHVRLSDMRSTPTLTQQTDDTKIVLFDEPKIDYFPLGAKLETMGSTWICTNPANLSDTLTSAVVRRCNTSYNLYDYYGNIVTEPIVLEKVTMMGNDNAEKPQNLVMMDGYFNVICQLNENTRKLGLNQRIILGTKAYFITGFNDFYQEFSGDYESTHILYFIVRIEEPQENDDVPNHIANGKIYSFAAEITEGQRELNAGDTLNLTTVFLKNGAETAGTDEHPVTWTWESDSPDVAEVDENGRVTAKSDGTARITARMAQNTTITASVELVVKEAATEPYVAFEGVIPQSVEQYETVTLTATYYEGGAATDKPIEWSFGGADKHSYNATVKGNSVEIYCYLADDTPLTVTATCEGQSATATIELWGL